MQNPDRVTELQAEALAALSETAKRFINQCQTNDESITLTGEALVGALNALLDKTRADFGTE